MKEGTGIAPGEGEDGEIILYMYTCVIPEEFEAYTCVILEEFEAEFFPLKYKSTTFEYKIDSVEVGLHYFK